LEILPADLIEEPTILLTKWALFLYLRLSRHDRAGTGRSYLNSGSTLSSGQLDWSTEENRVNIRIRGDAAESMKVVNPDLLDQGVKPQVRDERGFKIISALFWIGILVSM